MSAAKKLIETIREDLKGTVNGVASTLYFKLVETFPLQPITSKSQNALALKVVNKLISYANSEKNPDEGAILYLKTLAGLVGDFERAHYPSPVVSGGDMLAYLMELKGLTQADLSKELGGQSVVSQILKGKRELNLRQIKALAKRFKVSPQVFIG